jgi:hypothetical protein
MTTSSDPTWDTRTVPRGRRQRLTWVLHFADLDDQWIPDVARDTLAVLVRDKDVCRGLAALVGAAWTHAHYVRDQQFVLSTRPGRRRRQPGGADD